MLTYEVVVTAKLPVGGDGMTDQDLFRTQRALTRDVENVLHMYTGVWPEDLQVTVRRTQGAET